MMHELPFALHACSIRSLEGLYLTEQEMSEPPYTFSKTRIAGVKAYTIPRGLWKHDKYETGLMRYFVETVDSKVTNRSCMLKVPCVVLCLAVCIECLCVLV